MFTFTDGETAKEVYAASGGIITPPTLPERVGYTFDGWKDASGEIFDFSAPVTQNMTFTSVWAVKTYSIVFETRLDGTASDAAQYSALDHTYGTDTKLPEAKPITGYDFKGFYIGDDRITLLGANSVLSDTQVVAKYEKKILQVTFKNGIEELINDVYYGDSAIKPSNPQKGDGYTFKGWFADESGNTAFDFKKPITENTTIYAVFDRNEPTVPDEPTDPPTPEDPTEPNAPEEPEKDNVGLIVGLSVGGAAIVAGGAAAAVIIVRKKKKSKLSDKDGDGE